ncbi:hypothetical protein BIZ35_13310 [Heyndrickxia coagulans]|nr:hypothetical protein BIZ35_13310 [Heyndrickxia coagulans]
MTSLFFPKKKPIKGRICENTGLRTLNQVSTAALKGRIDENAGCCPFYLLHQAAIAAFFKTFAFKAVRILA